MKDASAGYHAHLTVLTLKRPMEGYYAHTDSWAGP